MMCMFYQTKTNRMIFVSNQEGVFQSEATVNYDSETKARSVIDDFISTSIKNEFTIDTVSVNDFQLSKTGVKVTLQLSENKISKSFDVSVKANKSED